MYKDVEKVKVMWSDWKIYQRTKCEVWTRVMGYIRPVSSFNLGKKAEYRQRQNFTEERVNNSPFIKKYLEAKVCSCNL